MDHGVRARGLCRLNFLEARVGTIIRVNEVPAAGHALAVNSKFAGCTCCCRSPVAKAFALKRPKS